MEDSEKGEQSIYKSVWHAMHPAKPVEAIGLSKLRDDMVDNFQVRLNSKAK